jgi:GAF domain-containing protein
MFNTLKRIISPPNFEDKEKTRLAGLLNSILIFAIVSTSLATPLLFVSTSVENRLPLLVVVLPSIALNVVAVIIMRRGLVTAASNIFIVNFSAAIFGSYLFTQPGSAGALLSLTIVIAITTLLLRPRAVLVLLVIIVAFTYFSIIAQSQGWITPVFSEENNPISNWFSNSLVFTITSLGLYFSSVSLRRALDNASESSKRLESTNRELEGLQKVLEDRVRSRTQELEKRANQLDAISGVARSTASLQNLEDLLPAVTRLVSQRFDYYHTGIFLLDEDRKFAVLRASNSDGGKRMLNRQHKLKLDTKSIVGFVSSRGEPRIALDVGTDAVYFDNPDLPNTRSEMALPLRVGGQVIGALDVQSNQPNAFTEADINILSTLADQVAIAIENARLFSASRDALKKSEETFTQYIQQEWSNYAKRLKTTGYKFDGSRTTPLDIKDTQERAKSLPKTGRLSPEKENRELSIPIRFRGQVIGVLDVKSKSGSRKWTQHDITLLEAVAERTALALENTRLIESSQRRASRERTIGEISTKIGAVSDIETIMQTAVEELGRRIGGAAEVTLELESERQ